MLHLCAAWYPKAHPSAVMQGLVTVRAFRQEKRFLERNRKLIDASNRCVICEPALDMCGQPHHLCDSFAFRSVGIARPLCPLTYIALLHAWQTSFSGNKTWQYQHQAKSRACF